ncbi:MAG: hypothetical protein A3I88_00650 [Candidatus Portnoybacteria bacterium RIFCSPLOWO2_12_FULL_39_9]|uniref:General secretion pathway GspH domain-containing protein n=1 Tax=Candidatus Portnoybacteria bacterium RIFCSPHIGHO2_12_FULL_38_9 TaxID=1801997 RepID=A0A1G2FEI3_9BACT|nr:MAG: hypothetical protein A3H00_01360 [Candidatus Portnoybacteria bacterium RBG_13_40_8]OGZ35948.1 MAG: hypothetical protein A2646_00545 [Candidatus Portnoybacteria bacterium RIFCSPHIGHO2_02_FULL_39_12]OGZ36459.1 MAG: hypothetical protein A3J64_02425 [Candidatus Portnoybacteria bacterium RIFCSPHIGHO2_12_FULL_38_9]OGZ39030.1 MAG: hypothetical protein A3F21_01050 [Candidatus Portnoybacteria bacterium RIFCSPLOWO2_01_FULL_38_39]OGZ41235.1 MAG: hypothetical protein A3I88_00650 [Candidatus Portnoy
MNKGFSFIEILVVIAVSAIIILVMVAGFSSFYKSQTLNSAVSQTISFISQARSMTLSSENASQYSLHFETSRIVLFKGVSFVEPNSNNRELVLPASVEIYDISLNGGGADLIFKRLTGETDKYGEVFFRSKANPLKIKSIIIEPSGIIGAD